MKSNKKISKNSYVRLYPVGVRKRKNGKFCAEIKHPFNKKMVWLGTFVTADEAFESYKSKKLQFEELVMAKQAKKRQKFEKSVQESLMSIAENTNSSNGVEEKIDLFAEEKQESLMGDSENSNLNLNSSNGVEEKSNLFAGVESDEELFKGTWVKISEGKEVMFSHNLGVPVIDNYGFLLGEFSDLDDLRFM
ncbi:hypothetical protein H5410_025338 [Solanum commersonii]|uniref:AP2/ERF domain-containing protein n=1 Tax=Solanum commersonii TaxID=4109 RepID=A0A9J5YY86_SOLCO|nr:hypothetical protein H5410_025338 [Solanum commersonii]